MRHTIILLSFLLAAGALPAAVHAQATAKAAGDIYTVENEHFRVEVDAAGGARIRSWVAKPSGREIIALWKGPGENGGALDDRAFFTAARYDGGIMHPGPDAAVLRLEARHASGLSVVKLLTARRGSPALEVEYEFRNGTQTPQTLWVRNYLLPGGKPQTDEHRYWVNADPAGPRKPVVDATDANGYYQAGAPPFAALWHRATGDGIAVLAPGADRLYYWRESREFPTFEWIYKALPPGKVLRAGVALATVSGQKTAPDWLALLAAGSRAVRQAAVSDLPGWVDEATRFAITPAERQRGFWLSIGAAEQKQRLPDALPIDLARDDDRYLAVTINALKDLQAPIRVSVPAGWEGQVDVLRETPGPDRLELLPLPAGALSCPASSRETLWLRVSSKGKPDGEHLLPLRLSAGGVEVPVTLKLRIWPVAMAAKRPFHVRGYWSLSSLTGGYDMTEKNLRGFDALLGAFSEMGGDVLDWLVTWHEVISRTKIAGTAESIAQVAKATPQRIDLVNPPRLDFSHFDPWVEIALKHGVNRIETFMEDGNGERTQWIVLDPLVGKGRVKAGTPEANAVLVWFYREFRRYFEEKGFQGFFLKIHDEIHPEHIPSYIENAKIARAAGWRPFTTITGMIPRTAEHIRTMDPHCDQWQLGFGSKDTFLTLTRTPFEVTQETRELKGQWGRYTNGGAEQTWALKSFGEGSATGIDPAVVEKIELLEDGKPLPVNGGAPWGNKTRGACYTAGALGTTLYVSPTDGADPAKHRYELRVSLRRPSPQGKPLAPIDATDEHWFYGGPNNSYRVPYASAWCYPIMVLHHGFQGYGQWAFYWWQKTDRIVWLNDDGRVTLSPTWCGFRDGYRDALLLQQLIDARGRESLDALVGGANAPLQIGEQTREVYRFTNVVNAADPLAVNAARREALRRLSEGRP